MSLDGRNRVAVVGGGIAGTLCSLVLKHRGVNPTIFDAGRNGLGGRLRGAPFLRAADPRLAVVCSMLEREGLLQRWEGRFGVLGSSGGGFLPAQVVTSTSIGGMNKANGEDDQNKPTVGGRSSASDAGDFCNFVDGSKTPTYVGIPSLSDLCPNICQFAGIEARKDTRIARATFEEGRWYLHVREGEEDSGETYDGLVLATHDASFVGGVVHFIAKAEVAASEYPDAESAMQDDDPVIGRLLGLEEALYSVREEGRMPVYTIQANFPKGFSNKIPFDAVSVPGSNLLQFLARNVSKPKRKNDGELWTAISTSIYADNLLSNSALSDAARQSEASKTLSREISQLLSPYHEGEAIQPLKVTAKQWGAAFTSRSLGLKEDSVALAPWRLTVCGDYIRDISEYTTPLEAAALSGLEAGERTASFFQQQEELLHKQ
jgi:predicted NAD/FAD-dependent oxidoreductase